MSDLILLVREKASQVLHSLSGRPHVPPNYAPGPAFPLPKPLVTPQERAPSTVTGWGEDMLTLRRLERDRIEWRKRRGLQ